MVFSIYEVVHVVVITKNYRSLSALIVFFLYFVDLMIKHLRTLSTGVATPLIKRLFKST